MYLKEYNISSCLKLEEEKGSGFIESLIAIIVAGIATIALLGIAITVIRESKNNEIRDAMNQYAVEGMEKVRWIAASDPLAIPSGTNEYCLLEDTVDGSCDLSPGEVTADPDYSRYFHDITIGHYPPCSQNPADGECGKLSFGSLPGFFYREVEMTQTTSGSEPVIEVVIKVGRLTCPTGADKSLCESVIKGFVPIP
ncbi:MAG: hypothetical protein U9Q67_01390 [Patescibacteria group bacterium]|nr:hypothetical protein [Patescibacteria group bacterium]